MSIHSLAGRSTNDVLQSLFDEYLPGVSDAIPDDIHSKFVLLRDGWGAQVLVEGTLDRIRATVLANLLIISRRPDFGSFQVEAKSETPPSVQLSALMVDGKGNTVSFVPVRVWRAGDTFYACGNADFIDDGA